MADAYAIVVPGHSRRGELSGRCRGLLRLAAVLADERAPRAVLFSGGAAGAGASEAEQMLAAWPGRRDVEFVVEPTAATTAQNAARSLPLLLERGVREAVVVCAPLHAARVAYFFGGIYGRYGVHCRVRVARAVPTPFALAWELAATTVARRQRRAALAELPPLG